MSYTRSAAVLLSLLAGSCVAPCVRADWSGTLASLNAQAPLHVGNATYGAFTVTGTFDSSAILATISSDAAGDSSITFSVNGGNWMPNADPQQNDSSVLQYSVTFDQPVISAGLSFVAQAAGGDAAGVGETATNPDVADPLPGQPDNKHTQLQVFAQGAPTDTFSQTVALAVPATTLNIVKSIDIYGTGGTASISSVTNAYYTPEPASLGLMGIGALAFLRRRR